MRCTAEAINSGITFVHDWAHNIRSPDYARADLRALKESGIRNYSIFRDGNQVFGYFEADDLTAAADHLGRQVVCTSWQDAMADLLEERVPDTGPPGLEQIFRLD